MEGHGRALWIPKADLQPVGVCSTSYKANDIGRHHGRGHSALWKERRAQRSSREVVPGVAPRVKSFGQMASTSHESLGGTAGVQGLEAICQDEAAELGRACCSGPHPLSQRLQNLSTSQRQGYAPSSFTTTTEGWNVVRGHVRSIPSSTRCASWRDSQVLVGWMLHMVHKESPRESTATLGTS